ncbi:MAG: DUF2062 domain-containing protein [Gammaproteobacteria bacterium]|nr:DUF2062 domain-containing protein [Gammaproteobacteria bacterium]
MPKKFLRRYLPNPNTMREHPALRPVSKWLNNPEIWHMHRRAVAGAAFIGLFCAFLPVPFQMLIAAFLAVASRCNLPMSVALVWITNPITMAPMFYFAYRLGAWLLNMQLEVETIDLSWSWLSSNLGTIGYPLVFGSLVCGWVSGVTGMVVVRIVWRMHVIRRWRARHRARLRPQHAATGATPPKGS